MVARSAHRKRLAKARGFSAIELLIVVAVILIIAAIAIPNLVSAINITKGARAVADIADLEDEIALYQSINNVLPDDLSRVAPPGLLDPWGNPYQYFNHATGLGNGQSRTDRFNVPLNTDYELYSEGRDKLSSSSITDSASLDDIIRAGDGSYVGLASRY